MPCESCHVQFTVFRRKRSCADCKRFYCSNCLTTTKRRSTTTTNNVHISAPGAQLCRRCLIFAKRPLLRTDLLQLKPKDLIFYLQSKHISTTGCVEKDELVGLVLSHVHQIDAAAGDTTTTNSPTEEGSGSARSYTESTTPHSFDSIKQSCQNFFTSITENISDSLNSFDNKATSPKAGAGGETRGGREACSGRGSTDSNASIFDQPRVSTREIPTYASFQQQFNNNNNNNYNITHSTTTTTTATTTSASVFVPLNTRTTTTTANNYATTSPTLLSSGSSSQTSVSPEISISSIDRALAIMPQSSNQQQHIALTRPEPAVELSDCACSDEDDDDLIATFSERSLAARKTNGADDSSNKESSLKNLETDERIANKSRASTDVNCAEISSHSSFEELGAIGGISDESKAATDTNSSNIEQWQILDNTTAPQTSGSPITEQSLTVACASSAVPPTSSNIHTDDTITDTTSKDLQVAIPATIQTHQMEQQKPAQPTTSQRVKKVTRRRSESFLNRLRQRATSEDDSPTSNQTHAIVSSTLHEQNTGELADAGAGTAANATDALASGNNAVRGRVTGGGNSTTSCQRCGKHKATLRKQVEKMRRHLESAQLSEAEIKKELKDFLSYLEQRSKSMECSDTETVGSSLSGRNYGPESPGYAQSPQAQHQQQRSIWEAAGISPWEYHMDDNAGIHVYAGTTSDMDGYSGQSSRFINLEDFETIDDLESLSVKQLKEILMLHRVDYKGCCEKQELLDRVQRLWKNLKSTPAVHKLPSDELCKICMDAPIECVILECGHMATCTNCGKVLSECPICRQYIVRVVRFFRA